MTRQTRNRSISTVMLMMLLCFALLSLVDRCRAITFDGLLMRYGATSPNIIRRKSQANNPPKRFESSSASRGGTLLLDEASIFPVDERSNNRIDAATNSGADVAESDHDERLLDNMSNFTEKVLHAQAVISEEPISCSYSTSDALEQRLRLRASFNPLLMSDTIDAAKASLKTLLSAHGYDMDNVNVTSRADEGKQDDEITARDNSEYFQRANFMATNEIMKNRQLNLREVCSLGGRINFLLKTKEISAAPKKTRRRRAAEQAVTASLTRKRRHRTTLGTQKQQFCLERGQQNEDGLLRLCKICAVVTELPADYYPRYINEIVCDSSDDGCLYAGPLPHGQCVPKTLQLTVLKRLVNHQCLEDWQPVKLEARVSCECFVYQSSFLRPFV